MKKNTFKTLLLLGFAIITSCSRSDDAATGGSVNPPAPDPTIPVSGKFTKNVLIEDYTGAWCGYCPRVAYGIDQVLANNIKAVPVAIHRGSTTVGSTSYDPYNFSEGATLESYINLSGYPTAMLNRKTTWSYPEPSNINQVKNLTGANSDLGLALSSTVVNGNINLNVNVKFDANFTNLKLVVYVLEDGLIYNQTNYTTYFGGTSVIQNFKHDHVLRANLTNILGDDIVATATTDGNTYTKNFTVSKPSNVSDPSKMSFVAFVIDYTGKAVNVRSAEANVTQTFQENP